MNIASCRQVSGYRHAMSGNGDGPEIAQFTLIFQVFFALPPSPKNGSGGQGRLLNHE